MNRCILNSLLVTSLGFGLLLSGNAAAERPMASRANHAPGSLQVDQAKHGGYSHRGNGYGRYDHRGERRNRHHDRYDRYDRYGDNGWRGHDRYRYPAPAYRYYRSPAQVYYHYSRYPSPWRYAHPHGYRYRHYQSGWYLPQPYFRDGYYVNYQRYGLRVPPYGYHWVRVDNDVVLAAIATGLIAEVVDDLFY